MKRLMNCVGGAFVPPSTQTWFAHDNPTTGEPQAEVPDSEFLDVVKAIQAAHKAEAGWAKLQVETRARVLDRIAEEFETTMDVAANIQSKDQGMPIRQSRTESLPQVVSLFRTFARLIRDETSSSVLRDQSWLYSNRQPVGVVGLLTPCADPLVNMAARVAPALAAGNTIILKPSEFAPETAHVFAETLLAAGLPSGVFNLVQGRGESAGRALVQHPGLSALSLIGRTETGRSVLRESAEFLRKTHLALSGRNPVLIFSEFDLEKNMPEIVAACFNISGQVCLRGSRILVQETVYKKFLDVFQAEVGKIKIGDPLLDETKLGPLASPLAWRETKAAIGQALAEKGKFLCGHEEATPSGSGPAEPGRFLRPTVIHDLTNCSTLQQEEIMGPVVTVSSFKYQHEAIKQANNSPFGRAAYVFHGHATKAQKIIRQIVAAQVFLNSGERWTDEILNVNGVKHSGLGGAGGGDFLRFFSHESVISQGLRLP